jgi:hypothetical protein
MNTRGRADSIFCGACLTAAAGLVWVPHAAVAQVFVPVPAAARQWLPAVVVAPGGDDGEAIGDPWWDEAEAKRPAAKKAEPDEPADDEPAAEETADAVDEAADEDADPQAQMQAQLRAQAEMMRTGARQQGLAILRRELSIVRQTCPSLERQQRALVLEAGRGAIEKAVDDQMTAALGRRRGRQADVETAIGAALRASVAANAAAEESAAYEVERGLRRERAKQATIALIVADVDRDAFLDDAEREMLAKALAESYRERWRQVVTALHQGMVEVVAPPPQGVDRCVERALGKERKAEWLARREEAQKLLAQTGGQQNGGMVQIQAQAEFQAQAVGGAGGVVRRVIRRQVFGNANGVQMQLEVQVGGGAEAEAEEDAGVEEEK